MCVGSEQQTHHRARRLRAEHRARDRGGRRAGQAAEHRELLLLVLVVRGAGVCARACVRRRKARNEPRRWSCLSERARAVAMTTKHGGRNGWHVRLENCMQMRPMIRNFKPRYCDVQTNCWAFVIDVVHLGHCGPHNRPLFKAISIDLKRAQIDEQGVHIMTLPAASPSADASSAAAAQRPRIALLYSHSSELSREGELSAKYVGLCMAASGQCEKVLVVGLDPTAQKQASPAPAPSASGATAKALRSDGLLIQADALGSDRYEETLAYQALEQCHVWILMLDADATASSLQFLQKRCVVCRMRKARGH